jgi:arylsulfatase A
MLDMKTIALTSMLMGGFVVTLAAAQPPNIVLIVADDPGAKSIGAFGGAIPTPNLDKLVQSGMTFPHCHAAPMCAPTRDELMTGLSRARFKNRPGLETAYFTQHLQKLGYQTCISGKWYVGSVFNPPRRGFDESCIMVNSYRHWAPDIMVFGSQGLFQELNQPPFTGTLNEWFIPLEGATPNKATRLSDRYSEDVAVDFLCDFIQRHQKGPFFAYYTPKLVHYPHAPNPDHPKELGKLFCDGYNRFIAKPTKTKEATEVAIQFQAVAAPWIKEEAKRRNIKLPSDKLYRDAGLTYLDKLVGRIVSKLGEAGLLDQTIVIYTSDNGNSALDVLREGVTRAPGAKGSTLDGGTLVPLVVNWPNKIKPGTHCDDLVNVQDFLPTFLELAGGQLPGGEKIDGRSFAPQLFGNKGNPREWFIGSFGKRVWVRGLRYKLYNDGRFYDLQNDWPEESQIKPGTGGQEAEAVRIQFQAILDKFSAVQKQQKESP